jgi:hypothetical protein
MIDPKSRMYKSDIKYVKVVSAFACTVLTDRLLYYYYYYYYYCCYVL